MVAFLRRTRHRSPSLLDHLRYRSRNGGHLSPPKCHHGKYVGFDHHLLYFLAVLNVLNATGQPKKSWYWLKLHWQIWPIYSRLDLEIFQLASRLCYLVFVALLGQLRSRPNFKQKVYLWSLLWLQIRPALNSVSNVCLFYQRRFGYFSDGCCFGIMLI